MTLQNYQQTEIGGVPLAVNTLYSIQKKGGISGLGSQIEPNIETIGGTVNIFMSQTKPASGSSGMTEFSSASAGIVALPLIANYLYIAQVGGTTTSIILTGIEASVAV